MNVRKKLSVLAWCIVGAIVLGGTTSASGKTPAAAQRLASASPASGQDKPSDLGLAPASSVAEREKSPREDALAVIVRAAYDRLARYSRRGNEPGLQFQLGGFKTIPPERFDTVPVADVVSEPTGSLIDVAVERHPSAAGGPTALYRASWSATEVPPLSVDDIRKQHETTLGDLTRIMYREIPEQAPILSVVTYEVTVDLAGRSRTYRAAFFCTRLPGQGAEGQSVEFVVQDPVTLGLAEAAEESARPSTGQDDAAPPAADAHGQVASDAPGQGGRATGARSFQPQAGPSSCTESSRVFPKTTPVSGQQFLAQLSGVTECRCDTSCYSTCTATITQAVCRATASCRKVSDVSYDIKTETRYAFGTPLGASCAYGAACGGKKCTRLFPFAPCWCGTVSVTVTIPLVKILDKFQVGIAFTPSNPAFKAQVTDSIACAPCFEGQQAPGLGYVSRWETALIEDNSETVCGDNLCDDGENCPADCSGPSIPGYQGCYTDDPNRALPAWLGGGHTIGSCIGAAAAQGYAYAGLQWYGECFAGNNLGYSRVGDAECNTPCNADPSQPCGGAWRNSIYATGSTPQPPQPPGGSDIMTPGTNLYAGASVNSSDGRFTFTYQGDGNLVLYQSGVGAIWSSGTSGTSAGRTAMQPDGNLVVYDAGGAAVWHTYTYGNPGAYLKVQSDGNTVLYAPGGAPLWYTGTCCR